MSAIILIILLLPLINADSCYAPPVVWGARCDSSVGLFGDSKTNVTYCVDVQGDTGVYCEGLYLPKNEVLLDWISIGMFGPSTDPCTLPVHWGASAGKPAIRCRGVPLGSALSWSWKA